MKTKVNEEKLLNEIFVTLEYSDSFKEFCENLSDEAFYSLLAAMQEHRERKFTGQ